MHTSWSPASWTASMSQSIHASTSARRGEPELAGCQPSPANLSSVFDENCRHAASWSSASTLTQNTPASRIDGHDEDDLPAQKPTSAGSSGQYCVSCTSTSTPSHSSSTESEIVVPSPSGPPGDWWSLTYAIDAPSHSTR